MKKLLSGFMKKKSIKSLAGKDKSLDKAINKEIIEDYNLIEKIIDEIKKNDLETKETLADRLFINIIEKAKVELDQSYFRFVSRINRLTEFGHWAIKPEESVKLEPERKEFANRYLRMKQCLMLKKSSRADYGFTESQIDKHNTSLTRLRELIDETAEFRHKATLVSVRLKRNERDVKLGKKPKYEIPSLEIRQKNAEERKIAQKELDKLELEIDEFERSLIDSLVDPESIIIAPYIADEFYALKEGGL